MEVIPGSVVEQGNGLLPPTGPGSRTAKGEKARGAAKPEKDVKGRKDAGQEVVPNGEELAKSVGRLKTLYLSKLAANDAFSKAVKASAKKAGFTSDVVRAVVKAHAGEKEDLELATRRAEQLNLAFESLAK